MSKQTTMQQYWVAKDGEVTLFDLEDGEGVEEYVSERCVVTIVNGGG